MVLIAADYSQLEYKVGVALAEAEEVLEKIRQGVDFHQICQDAMETFLQRPVQRVDAKRVNFQGMYGVSDKSLADALGCDIFQAGFFRKKQFAFAVDFRNRVNTKIKNEGFIETPYGRRRRFALLTPESIGDALKQGFNMIVQSTAIDVCYDSMLQLEPKLEKIGGGIVLNVHDEIVAEVPEDKVDEAKELMRSIMETKPAWSPINYTTELTVYKNWCLKKERN
jgi:DNA polymerase I